VDVAPHQDQASLDVTSANCVATLACGTEVLFADVGQETCFLDETRVGKILRYRAAFWTIPDSEPGEDSIEIVFHPDGQPRGHVVRYTMCPTGGHPPDLKEFLIRFDRHSLPRAGDPLLQTQRFGERFSRKGRLIDSDPSQGIQGPCTHILTPDDDFGQSSRCRSLVRCAGRVLYDGWGTCSTDSDGRPQLHDDVQPSMLDGDPKLLSNGNELTVVDVGPSRTWEARIELED
jgi:hypothetical protein